MPYGVLERAPHVRHGIRGMNLSGLRRVGSYRWGDVEAACIDAITCKMHAIVRGSERRVGASTGAIHRTEGAASFWRRCRRATSGSRLHIWRAKSHDAGRVDSREGGQEVGVGCTKAVRAPTTGPA